MKRMFCLHCENQYEPKVVNGRLIEVCPRCGQKDGQQSLMTDKD